jgi:hypothetical protein
VGKESKRARRARKAREIFRLGRDRRTERAGQVITLPYSVALIVLGSLAARVRG